MLFRARRRDRARALALCAHLPTQPLQVAAWIHEGGLEGARDPSALFLETGGGLAFVSELGVVMPHLQHRESVRELAWRIGSTARVVVGPSWATRTLWHQLERRGAEARIVRDQVGYSTTRSSFRGQPDPIELRVASSHDLDLVVEASAAMALEESKDDPARRNPTVFRARIAERIRKGRDFILRKQDQLIFKANVSALSPYGGHIEGVYTRPSARGRGIGRAGTAWVTRWILQQAPTATLLVNQDNTIARKIYEAIGFLEVYDSRTVLAR